MTATPCVRESEWTLGRLLSTAAEYLARHGVEDARLSTEVLLAHVAGCRRIDLYARFERILPDPQLGQFRELVKRASQHEPIAYLVGEKEFFSLSFFVARDVLIPRPETETLVEWCIDQCASTQPNAVWKSSRHAECSEASGEQGPSEAEILRCAQKDEGASAAQSKPLRILDLGTGSGCIAISCLVHLPQATAAATDISAAALQIAARNAERHKVADRLILVQADRLNVPDAFEAEKFNIVLCNPPYIPEAQVSGLHPRVRDFEPRVALTDSSDGLSFYRDLGKNVSRLLRDEARLAVEIGDGQSQAVMEVMTQPGELRFIAAKKDRVTGRERVLVFAPTQVHD